jgi:hypothetical protein
MKMLAMHAGGGVLKLAVLNLLRVAVWLWVLKAAITHIWTR